MPNHLLLLRHAYASGRINADGMIGGYGCILACLYYTTIQAELLPKNALM
jgi:hypothetical protein